MSRDSYHIRNMWGIRKLWDFWIFLQDIFGSSSLFILIFGSGGVVAVFFGILYTWLQNLAPIQIILFGVGIFCFLLVFIRWVYDKWQKHNTERIPDLIDQLDVMVWDYIDDLDYDMSLEEWASMLSEYGQLLNRDFHRFIKAVQEGEQDVVNREYEEINKAYNKKVKPENKMGQSIGDLRDMGELLNKYNVGLKACKETEQYQKLYTTIKKLQRQLPSILISARVNDYFYQSDGYYSMVISTKPLVNLPKNMSVPIKVTTKQGQVRPIIEGQIANLIAGIREGITKYKERDLEPTTENNNQVATNREERRKQQKRGW